MPDEPKFLKDLPPPAADAKPLPEAARSVLEPIVDAILDTRAAAAKARAPQTSWTVPLAGATDDAFDLGGFWLRFKVPQTWRERARGDLRREWVAGQVHSVTLELVRSRHTPAIEQLILERARTRPGDGYHHVQVTPIRHPSCFDAAEIIEVLATAPKPQPLRILQLLRHVRLALWVQLDAPAGTIVPGVSGEVAALFNALTFTSR